LFTDTLSQDDLPQRPATANELARLRAERPATANELARLRAQQHMKPDYGFANSVVDENGQPIPIRLPIPQLPPGAEGGRPPSAANRNRAAGPSVKFDPSLNEDIVEQSEWSQNSHRERQHLELKVNLSYLKVTHMLVELNVTHNILVNTFCSYNANHTCSDSLGSSQAGNRKYTEVK